jgi:hypothetical protein
MLLIFADIYEFLRPVAGRYHSRKQLPFVGLSWSIFMSGTTKFGVVNNSGGVALLKLHHFMPTFFLLVSQNHCNNHPFQFVYMSSTALKAVPQFILALNTPHHDYPKTKARRL